MMRERGVGNVQLFLDFADDQAFGMSGEQQLHDAQAGSVPMAENMSANLRFCEDCLVWRRAYFDICRNMVWCQAAVGDGL